MSELSTRLAFALSTIELPVLAAILAVAGTELPALALVVLIGAFATLRLCGRRT